MGSPYLLCSPHPAYSSYCITNIRLEVLQLSVSKAVELELRPISDSVRLHMAILLTRFSWCRAYTNCFSTRAWSSAIFGFMAGIVAVSCRFSKPSRRLTSALFFAAEILCCCWRWLPFRFGPALRARFGPALRACFGRVRGVETASRAASKAGPRSPPAQ